MKIVMKLLSDMCDTIALCILVLTADPTRTSHLVAVMLVLIGFGLFIISKLLHERDIYDHET